MTVQPFKLHAGFSQTIEADTAVHRADYRIHTLITKHSAEIGFVIIQVHVIVKFYFHTAIIGWTSIVILILLLGGIQLICLGIIGEYVGKIYEEAKDRPLYLIKDVF